MQNTDNDKYKNAIISSLNNAFREIEKANKEAGLTDSQKKALKSTVPLLDKAMMNIINWDFR